MSKDQKTKETPSPANQKAIVFACPAELWGEMVKELGSLPYERVGGLMGKVARVQAQEVEVRQG